MSAELGNLSLRAFEIGFSEEQVNDVFQKAILSRSGVEGICEDIQDMLVAAAVSKMNMASRSSSPSAGTDQNTSSGDSVISGDDSTDTSSIIPSPSGGISTPSDADDKPDSDDNPDGDSSPPEN